MNPLHRVAAIMCAISFLLCVAEMRAQSLGKVTFTCPPCGCPGDKLELESSGTCPHCGMKMVEQSELRNVAVLVYNGMQLADFTGAYSVFEAARTFNVFSVSVGPDSVATAFSPVTILPRYTLNNAPKADILIIPGGLVGRTVSNQQIISKVREMGQEARLVLSVCTGAFILAKTGLIDGLSSTVLEEDIEQLRRAAPKVNVVTGKRFVDNGKFLSSAGPLSGMDASLHMLTRLFGTDTRANAVAKFLDYQWVRE